MARGRRYRHLGLLLASGVVTAVSMGHVPPHTGATQFGASVYRGSSSWEAAVHRADDRYGNLQAVRVFYPGLPGPWDDMTAAVDTSLLVSFKADPVRVLSGTYDQRLKQWFDEAPRNRDIWWTYYHEPENNVEHGDFTAEQWRAAYKHIATIANAAHNPHLYNSIVLMCWTLDPASGRSFADYFPGADLVDTIGWDCYSEPTTDQPYEAPQDLYASAIATSRSAGVGWGIAETGAIKTSTDPSGELRAAWLLDVGQYLADEGAQFVLYFDSPVGGEFRLLDKASQGAWRQVLAQYGPSGGG